jgi:hypothetical protein
LIAFELLTATTNPTAEDEPGESSCSPPRARQQQADKTTAQFLAECEPAFLDLFKDLDALLVLMGDDVTKTERKFYSRTEDRRISLLAMSYANS